MGNEILYLADVPADSAVGGNREAPFRSGTERLVMGREIDLPDRNMIERAEKAAAAHFGRVLELQRAGSGIAGIGKRRVLGEFPFGVQPIERVVGHQHLAADFELRRPAAAGQDMRDVGDLQGVTGHVVADHAVAAGQGTEQPAVAIGQTDGRAVELELAAIRETALQGLGGPFGEGFHLFHAIGVAEREHGVFVRELGKAAVLEVGSDATGGGVGTLELRPCRLELLQLMHPLVVLEIGHRRRILDIVFPGILSKELP